MRSGVVLQHVGLLMYTGMNGNMRSTSATAMLNDYDAYAYYATFDNTFVSPSYNTASYRWVGISLRCLAD